MFKVIRYLALGVCAAMMLCFVSSAENLDVEFVKVDLSELFELQEGDDSADSADSAELISTAAELCAFRDAVNNGEKNTAHVKLAADIVIGEENWTPIGTEANPFKGSFDGDGHTISGLNITSCDKYAGLFGYVAAGNISNVCLYNPTIEVNAESGNVYAGFLAGYVNAESQENSTYISKISISGGNAKVSSKTGSVYCGAIAGYAQASSYAIIDVSDCYVKADIKAVSEAKSAWSGLIAGEFNSNSSVTSTIRNCVVSGSSIAQASTSGISGLVVGNCFANGAWISPGGSLQATGKVSVVVNCAADGSISASGSINTYVGFIAGYLSGEADVENSYYTESSSVTAGEGVKTTASGTSTALENLYNGTFVSETLKLDTENTWKVSSEALPKLLIFENKVTVNAPGDVNSDGKVDTDDLLKLSKYLAGWDIEFTQAESSAADVTGDEKVDCLDILRLLKYLAGWKVELK